MPLPALLLPIIGALAGAGIGAGVNKENRLKGALVGAGIGGLGGYGANAGIAKLGAAKLGTAVGSVAGDAVAGGLGGGAASAGSTLAPSIASGAGAAGAEAAALSQLPALNEAASSFLPAPKTFAQKATDFGFNLANYGVNRANSRLLTENPGLSGQGLVLPSPIAGLKNSLQLLPTLADLETRERARRPYALRRA